MTYYWFYRRKLSRKARDRYHYGGGKEKATRYYCKNREIWSKKAGNRHKKLSGKEKEVKREYQRTRYRMISLNEALKQYQRDHYDSRRIKKWNINFPVQRKTE